MFNVGLSRCFLRYEGGREKRRQAQSSIEFCGSSWLCVARCPRRVGHHVRRRRTRRRRRVCLPHIGCSRLFVLLLGSVLLLSPRARINPYRFEFVCQKHTHSTMVPAAMVVVLCQNHSCSQHCYFQGENLGEYHAAQSACALGGNGVGCRRIVNNVIPPRPHIRPSEGRASIDLGGGCRPMLRAHAVSYIKTSKTFA